MAAVIHSGVMSSQSFGILKLLGVHDDSSPESHSGPSHLMSRV